MPAAASVLRRFQRVLAALLLLALAAAASAGDKLFLWEVQGQRTSVFLLGTVHFWKAENYPLPAPIDQAFRGARVLAVELDPTLPDAQERVLRRALYASGDSLDRHLPPALLADAKQASAQFGIDEAFVLRAKPWLLGTVLLAAAAGHSGYQPDLGIDAYLVAGAKAQGKRIVELESADQQVDLFESMGPGEQVLFVRQAVELIRDGAVSRMFDELAEAWRKGDGEAMATMDRLGLEDEPQAEAFLKRLLTDRNVAMTDKIVALIDGDEPALVAVGAAHLSGKGSIVELLESRGYAVRQMER